MSKIPFVTLTSQCRIPGCSQTGLIRSPRSAPSRASVLTLFVQPLAECWDVQKQPPPHFFYETPRDRPLCQTVVPRSDGTPDLLVVGSVGFMGDFNDGPLQWHNFRGTPARVLILDTHGCSFRSIVQTVLHLLMLVSYHATPADLCGKSPRPGFFSSSRDTPVNLLAPTQLPRSQRTSPVGILHQGTTAGSVEHAALPQLLGILSTGFHGAPLSGNTSSCWPAPHARINPGRFAVPDP
jgi:hypothetical protein